MPTLRPGKRPETIRKNIREMIKAGYTRERAVAAAMRTAGIRQKKRKTAKKR
jgi:hypothetical protein